MTMDKPVKVTPVVDVILAVQAKTIYDPCPQCGSKRIFLIPTESWLMECGSCKVRWRGDEAVRQFFHQETK